MDAAAGVEDVADAAKQRNQKNGETSAVVLSRSSSGKIAGKTAVLSGKRHA